jgi:hypothetical protein
VYIGFCNDYSGIVIYWLLATNTGAGIQFVIGIKGAPG